MTVHFINPAGSQLTYLSHYVGAVNCRLLSNVNNAERWRGLWCDTRMLAIFIY